MEEIKTLLKSIDEITLLEMFRLTSDDLVDRFQDLVEDDPDRYNRELAQFFDGEEDEETEEF